MNIAGQGKQALNTNLLQEVEEDLKKLLEQSRKIIEKNRFRFEDARLIASYLTEMRFLLDALSKMQAGSNTDAALTGINVFRNEILELEGIVKELRNSLEQRRPSRD